MTINTLKQVVLALLFYIPMSGVSIASHHESQDKNVESINTDQLEVERTKAEECDEDWGCRMNRHSFVAGSFCLDHITKYAEHGYKFARQDSTNEITWADFDHGILRVSGDQLMIKNEQGIYQNYRYMCEYDVIKGRVVNGFVGALIR